MIRSDPIASMTYFRLFSPISQDSQMLSVSRMISEGFFFNFGRTGAPNTESYS